MTVAQRNLEYLDLSEKTSDGIVLMLVGKFCVDLLTKNEVSSIEASRFARESVG